MRLVNRFVRFLDFVNNTTACYLWKGIQERDYMGYTMQSSFLKCPILQPRKSLTRSFLLCLYKLAAYSVSNVDPGSVCGKYIVILIWLEGVNIQYTNKNYYFIKEIPSKSDLLISVQTFVAAKLRIEL